MDIVLQKGTAIMSMSPYLKTEMTTVVKIYKLCELHFSPLWFNSFSPDLPMVLKTIHKPPSLTKIFYLDLRVLLTSAGSVTENDFCNFET